MAIWFSRILDAHADAGPHCPAFTSYGGFWLSFATIFIPDSGILAAYADVPASELNSALGIYLITWFVVTLLLL